MAELLSTILFCGGLLTAAVHDIRTRTVHDGVCLIIALAGLCSLSPASLLGLTLGALPFYLGSGLGKNGAGDITLCAAVGFVLGPTRTAAGLALFAVCYGIFVLGDALVSKLHHRPSRTSCPLVPFLAAGFLPAYFFA